MYGVYDLKDKEMCVGIFKTTGEVAKFFKTTRNTIRPYITRKNLRECRYQIVKIKGDTDDL